MIRGADFFERLWKATGFVPHKERRETAIYKQAYADAWAAWEAQPFEEREEFVDPEVSLSDSEWAIWKGKLGIDDPYQDDPVAEGRELLEAIERYVEDKLKPQARASREAAATTDDYGKRRRAENRAYAIEREIEEAEAISDALWGRVHRAVYRFGPEDDVTEARNMLRCRCRAHCQRVFRDSASKRAAYGIHPDCLEEARERRAAGESEPDTYLAGLLARLP